MAIDAEGRRLTSTFAVYNETGRVLSQGLVESYYCIFQHCAVKTRVVDKSHFSELILPWLASAYSRKSSSLLIQGSFRQRYPFPNREIHHTRFTTSHAPYK